MKPASEGKNRRLPIAAASAASAIAVVWWTMSGPPSLEQVARHTLSAIESGDGKKALKYLQEEEIKALKLTSEKLTLLLRSFNQYQKDPIHEGEVKVSADSGPSHKSVSKRISFPDNKEMELIVSAIRTDDGPKAVSLIYHLFMASATEDFPKAPEQRKGLNKQRRLIDAFPRVADKFKSAGINGLYISSPDESFSFTWDEYYKHITDKYRIAQTREAEYDSQKQNLTDRDSGPQ